MGIFFKILIFCGCYFKNISSDLDRHSHLPFFKMMALKTNDAISCELYHLIPIYLYNDLSMWLGFLI